MTIFLVEQNASQALALADRGYVLETGRVVVEGSGRELLSNEKCARLIWVCKALTSRPE